MAARTLQHYCKFLHINENYSIANRDRYQRRYRRAEKRGRTQRSPLKASSVVMA